MTTPATQLQKIQSSPHHIKMRWLIGISAVIMAIVIAVWLLAFPSMVAIAPPVSDSDSAPAPELSGMASVWESFFGNSAADTQVQVQ